MIVDRKISIGPYTMSQQRLEIDLNAVEHSAYLLCKQRNFQAFSELLKVLDSSFLQRKFVGEKTSIGRCFLTWAIKANEFDIVTSLLQKGVDVTEFHKGQTALHLAATVGCISLMEKFIEGGADPNTLDAKGNTVLSSVLKCSLPNKMEVIRCLLHNGSDWTMKNADGKKPIHLASTMSADLVHLFVTAGSDVNAHNEVNGDTPLHVACARCNQETILSLLLHGASINSLNFDRETPLVKLLKCAKNSNDFHSRSRRRVANFLVQLGANLGCLNGCKCIKSPVHRRCLHSYRNITLHNRNVSSLKHLARLSIRNCMAEIKGENSDMPIPEGIKLYVRFLDIQTVEFMSMMLTTSCMHKECL